jgi:hypothetical protein
MSALNDTFALQLTAMNISYEREYKAITGRRFAYDFYAKAGWSKQLLIEIQGGTWMAKSGHNTGKGIFRDCEKLNLAILEGYAVMHFTTDMVEDGTAIDQVVKYLEVRK